MTPAVYCGCGAQWHSRYVTSAEPIIAAHRDRAARGIGMCERLSHGTFRQRFICGCEDCKAQRKQKRRKR